MAARTVALCIALLHDDNPTPASIEQVLRAHGEPGPFHLTPTDLTQLKAAAQKLTAVFASSQDPDQSATLLNNLLTTTANPPRLTSHQGTTTWHLHVDAEDDTPWADWFLAQSAMALATLFADQQRLPGGLCASPTCGKPYLDTGGGSPRRYCSTRCATRERVAAHRATRP
ncbi:CGNR zinc finger domain-containing protein [Nonomuraea sp. NPDC050556]|uniref:CGNR zinc finger domain-containing protein n=1 Tax=Nonomuraea sp. NPDC050556 TaxID=3364369 RepID=UPI0037BDF77B